MQSSATFPWLLLFYLDSVASSSLAEDRLALSVFQDQNELSYKTELMSSGPGTASSQISITVCLGNASDVIRFE